MDIVHVNHPSKKPLGQNDYDDDNDEVRPIIQPVRQTFS